MPPAPSDPGGQRWSPRRRDGLVRGNSRFVENALTVAVLGMTTLFGVFLVIARELAIFYGSIQPDALGRWLPWIGLAAALLIGGGGAARGHREGRATAPWAFLGMVIWIVAAVLTLARG